MVDITEAIKLAEKVVKIVSKLPQEVQILTGIDELLVEAKTFLYNAGSGGKHG